MYCQLYNLSGSALKLPGLGNIAAHARAQRFYDITPEQFTSRRGPNVGEALRREKAAGNVDYNFVLEAGDYGAGRVGVKTLVASFARGSFSEGDTSQVFTDDDALPDRRPPERAHGRRRRRRVSRRREVRPRRR